MLVEHACHNSVAAVRQQAAERITDEDNLKRLLKEARRDRQVVRLARKGSPSDVTMPSGWPSSRLNASTF